MNGYLTSLLLWVTTGLAGLLSVMVGFIVKQHLKSDDEHRERQDHEIEKLRDRVHELHGRFGEVITRLRWLNEDSEKTPR